MKGFSAFNADQNRLMADAANQYEQWLAAKRLAVNFAGWMSFRTKNGNEYLTFGQGNGQNNKSLGRRSPETEQRLLAFTQGKEYATAQLDAIQTRLAERAPQLKAVRLGRILAPLAQVIREFDVQGMIGSELLVAGTHAITAYEAMAGHFFDAELTATENLDLVWRQRKNAEILVKNSEPCALLKHLKTVDGSYTVNTERTFQVRNNKGLVVDFISDEKGVNSAPKEYLKPIALPGQEWLINAATLNVVAIDTTGLPVKLAVPDPRMFALHKAWVSQRADRNPLKKAKDLNQAFAVAALVKQFLPQLPFDRDFIASLSDELRESFAVQIEPVMAQMGLAAAPLM